MNRKLVQFLMAGLLMTQVVAGQTRPAADSPQDSPRRAGASAEGQQQTTNTTIERLLRERRSEEEIVRRIQDAMRSGTAQFDISPTALVDLHKKGASDRVLNAMMGDGSVRYGRTSPVAAPNASSGGGRSRPLPAGSPLPALIAKLQLSKGPVIHISGVQPSLAMNVMQALNQQSAEAHTQKAQLATAGPAKRTNVTQAVAVRTAPAAMLAPRTNMVGQTGTMHTMDSTPGSAADGTTPDPAGGTPAGGDPTGGNPLGGNPTGGTTPPGGTGSTPTGNQPSGKPLTLAQMEQAPKPMSMCMFTTDRPVVESVSGRMHDIYFTPDPGSGPNPNNQYTIRGCNFGAAQGQGDVHLIANFKNNPSPVKLGVDLWSDKMIEVTFNPNFQNEYDMDNVTLVVVSNNGANTQVTGNHFVATRASRPLARIPKSLVTLPTTYLWVDRFASPVTQQTLQLAGMPVSLVSGTIQFQQFDPIWDSPTNDGYPPQRLSYGEQVNFSKLNPGFQVDGSIQTFIVNGGLNSATCKYPDTIIGATMQGSSLGIGVQPAECDDYGKFISASYGLQFSVTGPAGGKLDPWPTGLN